MVGIPSQKMSNYPNNIQQMQLLQQQQNFSKQKIYGGIKLPPTSQYDQSTLGNTSIFGKFSQQTGILAGSISGAPNVPGGKYQQTVSF